jgi:hypothetical protein
MIVLSAVRARWAASVFGLDAEPAKGVAQTPDRR